MPDNTGRREFMRVKVDETVIFEGKNNEHILKAGEAISFEKRTDLSLMHKIDANKKITLLAMVDDENDIRSEMNRLNENGQANFLDSRDLAFHISAPDALRMNAHAVMPEKKDNMIRERVVDSFEVKSDKMLITISDDPVVRSLLKKGDVLVIEEKLKGNISDERTYSKMGMDGEVSVLGKESAEKGYNATAEINHYKRRGMISSLESDFSDSTTSLDAMKACRGYVDDIKADEPKKRKTSGVSFAM